MRRVQGRAKRQRVTAESDLIRSGAVTAEELRMYTDADIVPALVHDAHYQRLADDAIKASQDFGDLKHPDAHLENTMQYKQGDYLHGGESALRPDADPDIFIDDGGDDDDDPPTFVADKDFDPELSPVVIPPDNVDSDASSADVAPEDVPTPTAPVPTPTPSVIHICDTPGCRRRPESDPCGLQYKSLSTFDATCACFLTDGNARLPATPST